jgi:hypothetical protein
LALQGLREGFEHRVHAAIPGLVGDRGDAFGGGLGRVLGQRAFQRAMRTQRENFSISGLCTLTTGLPVARYSRSLSGLELATWRFIRYGMIATSKALAHCGRVA